MIIGDITLILHAEIRMHDRPPSSHAGRIVSRTFINLHNKHRATRSMSSLTRIVNLAVLARFQKRRQHRRGTLVCAPSPRDCPLSTASAPPTPPRKGGYQGWVSKRILSILSDYQKGYYRYYRTIKKNLTYCYLLLSIDGR